MFFEAGRQERLACGVDHTIVTSDGWLVLTVLSDGSHVPVLVMPLPLCGVWLVLHVLLCVQAGVDFEVLF